jgi:hypothetical protein
VLETTVSLTLLGEEEEMGLVVMEEKAGGSTSESSRDTRTEEELENTLRWREPETEAEVEAESLTKVKA